MSLETLKAAYGGCETPLVARSYSLSSNTAVFTVFDVSRFATKVAQESFPFSEETALRESLGLMPSDLASYPLNELYLWKGTELQLNAWRVSSTKERIEVREGLVTRTNEYREKRIEIREGDGGKIAAVPGANYCYDDELVWERPDAEPVALFGASSSFCLCSMKEEQPKFGLWLIAVEVARLLGLPYESRFPTEAPPYCDGPLDEFYNPIF